MFLLPVGPPLAATAAESPVPPAAWRTSVEALIRDSEYRLTWQDRTRFAEVPSAWQAPNRAQNLRFYFTPTGFRAIPRTTRDDEPAPWTWGLSFIGCAAEPLPAAAPVTPRPFNSSTPSPPCVEANRIEYHHGDVIEWYINDPRGLEQGFTILKKPSAVGQEPSAAAQSPSCLRALVPSCIRISLSLSGTVTANISPDAQSIDFLAPGGALAIRFSTLHAADATGRALPVWFVLCDLLSGGENSSNEGHCAAFSKLGTRNSQLLSIVVDDTNATYPLTIDPLATSPSWTAESNQSNAWFGVSVAGAGDVNGDGYSDVIVGAPLFDNGQTDEGTAFVYFGSASGLGLQPQWRAEGNQFQNGLGSFGFSVACAGDVNADGFSDVIVGDPRYRAGNTYEGRALVYYGAAGGIQDTPAWTTEGNADDARYGGAVASAGDVNADGFSDVIIGAVQEVKTIIGPGVARVYHGSAAGLSQVPQWQVFGGQPNAAFGTSVSSAGDVNGDGFADVLVGEPGYRGDNFQEGRVQLYFGSAAGLSLGPNWQLEGNQDRSDFGRSVASAGDVNGDGFADVLIGAPLFSNGQDLEGRAIVCHGSALGPGPQPSWISESNQLSALWGWSVAGLGDVNGDGYSDVLVGAQLFDNGQSDEGRAALFLGSAAGLSAAPEWTAESNQLQARYGLSVGAAGDINGDGFADAVVGAHWYDNGQLDEGRAYAYFGSPRGLARSPAWTAEGNQALAQFGLSVDAAGDVNGDGFGDVIVGAPFYDNGTTDEGAAFVFLGSAAGLGASPAWSADDNQPASEFGASVAGAGDVNGDGYDDVLVGAPRFDNIPLISKDGRAWLYLGSSTGLGSTPNWFAGAGRALAFFGTKVAPAGDVNGDGFADVIIGAPGYTNGQTSEGRAVVYHGSPTGLPISPSWSVESDQPQAELGRSVSSAGDVNRDGFSDVLVAAPGFDNGQADEGRVWLHLGSPAGLKSAAAWTVESNQDNAQLGEALASAGDVNGDGFADVAVAAPRFDGTFADEGAAFVYHGGPTGLGPAPDRTFLGGQLGAEFGAAVASAGDINGDGACELIVGARLYDNGTDQDDEGRAVLYPGSPTGLAVAPSWQFECNQRMARLGAAVAGAGDVNGDGYADVIVAAPLYDNVEIDEGRAWLFFGNGGPGLPVFARQLRTNNNSRISPLGRSNSISIYRLAARCRSPAGRAAVKLEYEAKPVTIPFTAADLRRSLDFVDSGLMGATLTETVRNPLTTRDIHWRLRVLYARPSSPLQRHGPWISPANNGWGELDLRLAPPSREVIRDGVAGP